jgi:hypothetical protein
MSKAIPLQNANVVPLHQADALILPLAEGAVLRITPFRETPRVALSIFGPGGGDAGGVILSPARARLLASWLVMAADECEGTRPASRPHGPSPVVPLR